MEGPRAPARDVQAEGADTLLVVDADGRITYVSQEADLLFRTAPNELHGQRVCTLIDAWLKSAERRDPATVPFEFRVTDVVAGGGLAGAAVRVLVAKSPRRRFRATDVTRARRAEQSLRGVLAAVPDAMVGVDETGTIQFANGQAELLFGWGAEELIGMSIDALVPDGVRDKHVAQRSQYLTSPISRRMGAAARLSGRRRDGSEFPAEISLHVVQDPNGGRLVLSAIRDVTDRLQAEAEHQRLVLEARIGESAQLETLGQLASGVAHDFNNLLGVILNYNLTLEHRVTDPVALSDIAEIRAAAERASILTRQLLAFARRDAVLREPVDLVSVVQDVASMLARIVGSRVDVKVDLAPDTPPVVADRHQLEQIVLNLAINARDAMADGGVLTITTAGHPRGSADGASTGPTHASLGIADTGYGMTAEVLARACDPFFTTKPRGQGTGLGLSVVYGIVTEVGGEISIDSTVGVGTSVTVLLRRSDEIPPAKTDRALASVGGHERILLVDDSEALLTVTGRLLESRGYSVVTAADGVEALAVLENHPGMIDIVVTDVAMPRTGGYDLASQMSTRGLSLPTVFITGGNISEEMRADSRVLAKPVEMDILLASIREALDDRP